ncbi:MULTISPECIES: hypothetical protein [unclassified Streptomyces]|uniref:hypothetical protein n=1 Tax=unclassified Streptomyces TaxID=2593676 RepID=UPI00131A010B|nr:MULTISPECIES: hypothetical protein [unclassified Streptomyces]MYT27452.1 hypothetical protein [Streptomyces sp. SID8354]
MTNVTHGNFSLEIGRAVRDDPFDDKPPPQRRGGPDGQLIHRRPDHRLTKGCCA